MGQFQCKNGNFRAFLRHWRIPGVTFWDPWTSPQWTLYIYIVNSLYIEFTASPWIYDLEPLSIRTMLLRRIILNIWSWIAVLFVIRLFLGETIKHSNCIRKQANTSTFDKLIVYRLIVTPNILNFEGFPNLRYLNSMSVNIKHTLRRFLYAIHACIKGLKL